MTPAGAFVVAWSGKGTGDSQGVFSKIYKSPTDTAGPIVSDCRDSAELERAGFHLA